MKHGLTTVNLLLRSDTVNPPGQALGKGADKVRHSAYIEAHFKSVMQVTLLLNKAL